MERLKTPNTSCAPDGSAASDIDLMLCTAGHVDHGKTRLVSLLTGCNTDRLKTEQERGLTIELGFAPCTLAGGTSIGLVDVPGHEKFVRNMVAGVSGIGMSLLVIAADDGVMPQTVEHVQIMELLGVTRGMVALTKIDLVTEDRQREAISEVRGFLKGTFLEGAPICPVSAETGEGYDLLYETLCVEAGSISREIPKGVFRMPVAHVFSSAGMGRVAMGIPVDGSIRAGDMVELTPGSMTGRVRGIQQFMRLTDSGGMGQCLGLNIPDFNKRPPERGQVLALPGYVKPARTFHVRLRAVPGLTHPIRNAEEIKFHTGTVEEVGKCYLLEAPTLGGGAEMFATIIIARDVAAAPHDRFIIRRPSPVMTIGGGTIIECSTDTAKPRKKQVADRLTEYCAVLGDTDPRSEEGMAKRIDRALFTAPGGCADANYISRATFLIPAVVTDVLSHRTADGAVIALDGDLYVHGERFGATFDDVVERIERAAVEGALSLSRSEMRSWFDLSEPLWKRIEAELDDRGLVRREGATFTLAPGEERLDDTDRDLIAAILETYEKTRFRTPRQDELPALLDAPADSIDRLLAYLVDRGSLVRLTNTVIMSRGAVSDAQDIVTDIIERDGMLDSADFKCHIDSSRKYALAILDFLDTSHVTIRAGSIRTLSPAWRRHRFE
jgi:selenocysteine-specific elongation factor